MKFFNYIYFLLINNNIISYYELIIIPFNSGYNICIVQIVHLFLKVYIIINYYITIKISNKKATIKYIFVI